MLARIAAIVAAANIGNLVDEASELAVIIIVIHAQAAFHRHRHLARRGDGGHQHGHGRFAARRVVL